LFDTSEEASMNIKTVYLFDPLTGESLGAYEAQESPLEPGTFIEPVASTAIAPPTPGERQAVVFEGAAWVLKPDFRSVVLISTITGAPVTVSEIGPQPADTTELPQPSSAYKWVAGAWVVDLPTLKVSKNAAINAARLTANRSAFTHAGKVFACDELSRSDIDGANGYVALYDALPPGWPGGWKAVDNTYHPIAGVAEWKAFYTSIFLTGNANFAHAQTLKAALANATTTAQVAAVVW
jgi:hypothetical protein